jgi:hypothetical protein
MAGEIDPQYAARFRRDYVPAVPSRPRRAPGIVLLALAVVLAALAVGAVSWEVLDAAFRVQPVPDPLAAARALARAAPGPFVVTVVVALSGGLALLGLPRRAVVVASAAFAAALLAVVVRGATELVRLTSLTAQGPVSSGGIPLPEPALAVYFQRVQMIVVLDRVLPWLVLAAALEVVATMFLAGILSPRRPA